MANAAQQLPVFPSQTSEQGFRVLASLFTSVADVAKIAEPGSPWLKETLAAIEASEDLAEAAFGELRRVKHLVRCKLGVKK